MKKILSFLLLLSLCLAFPDSVMAKETTYEGKPIQWKLTDRFGMDIPKDALYVPHYRYNCKSCGSRLICNGCSDCGRCEI